MAICNSWKLWDIPWILSLAGWGVAPSGKMYGTKMQKVCSPNKLTEKYGKNMVKWCTFHALGSMWKRCAYFFPFRMLWAPYAAGPSNRSQIDRSKTGNLGCKPVGASKQQETTDSQRSELWVLQQSVQEFLPNRDYSRKPWAVCKTAVSQVENVYASPVFVEIESRRYSSYSKEYFPTTTCFQEASLKCLFSLNLHLEPYDLDTSENLHWVAQSRDVPDRRPGQHSGGMSEAISYDKVSSCVCS